MSQNYLSGPAVSGSVWDDAHVTQKNAIGTRVQIGDRVYRYCRTDADIERGMLVVLDPDIGPSANTSLIIDASTNYFGDSSDAPASGEGGSVGDTQVEVYNGSGENISAGEFSGGFLHITDATGEGYSYAVKDNEAIDDGESGLVTLFEPLVVALDATSEGFLSHSMYYDVEAAAGGDYGGDPDQVIIGRANVEATASSDSETQYLWIQTWGPCCLQVGASETLSRGKKIQLGENAADDGLVEDSLVEGAQDLGYALEDQGTADAWCPCFLTINP